jgi:hypothetical protein
VDIYVNKCISSPCSVSDKSSMAKMGICLKMGNYRGNEIMLRRYLNIIVLLFLISVLFYLTSMDKAGVIEDEVTAEGTIKAVQAGKKVTIISIPGLSFLEWQEPYLSRLPNMRDLIDRGAVGAMNIRTSERGLEDRYLSLGAGTDAVARAENQGFNRSDIIEGHTASELYYRYTDEWPEGEVVVPHILAVHELNSYRDYGASPGLLGERLQKNGVELYVLGNLDLGMADTHDQGSVKRYAPLMLIDQKGTVRSGNVGAERNLVLDSSRPYGVRSNYAGMYEQWQKAGVKRSKPQTAHMGKKFTVREKSEQEGRLSIGSEEHLPIGSAVLMELGDLFRLYQEKSHYSQPRFEEMKRLVLGEIDQFIGKIADEVQKREGDALWIISPEVHPDAEAAKYRLAPVLLLNGGMDSDGGVLLSSPTTRRTGIVSYVDFAPSIWEQFGIPREASVIGYPMRVDIPGSISFLQRELDRISRVYELRPPMLYSVVIYEIVVLLLSLALLLRNVKKDLGWLKPPLFSIIAAPLVMLWMGYFTDCSIAFLTVFFLIVLIGISWLASRAKLIEGMAWLSAVCALSILVDGFLGAAAMKHSVLGYDPMIGARYYGIGNEFMGVLIGAAVLSTSLFLQQWVGKKEGRRRMAIILVLVIYGTVIFYLAAPFLGTNAGGAITATAAFGLALVRFVWNWQEIRWMRLFTILGGLLAGALGLLWIFNAFIPPGTAGESHIGRALRLLADGRIDMIAAIIERKLLMNLHLIGVSSWGKVLITCLVVMAVMLMRPGGIFRAWQTRRPCIMYGFSAISAGSIVALAMNDSGIVAAATMIVYAAVPMLLLKLQDNEHGVGQKH